MSIYNIRPHHGLCAHFFEGKGYHTAFVLHMTAMLENLSNRQIKLVLKTDSICQACPHQKNKICISQNKVVHYDKKVLKLCSLQEHDVLNWNTFLHLVEKNIIRKGRLFAICPDCQWFSICSAKAEQAVRSAYE